MNENRLILEPGKKTILCIGAHPDDCELRCSGTAALWAKAGNRVIVVSMTDGRSGHHIMKDEEIAERRRKEAAEAAALIGSESRVLDTRDGHLEPTLENRFRVIRLVRDVCPDVIITNRPNDYHPDHRYTSLLVQDSAYMFMVPHVVPEVPALTYNPVIFYWADRFQYPREFKPDIVIDIDPAMDTKLAMLNEHTSQMYEWLPWIDRIDKPVPDDPAARLSWLLWYYQRRNRPSIADRFRDFLVKRYGPARGNSVKEAEAFELCEYGTRPDPKGLNDLFREI
jgi:LmbE family N-acetylglucosaminyl deacetylase